MPRFSYEDQAHRIAVLVDGKVTGHLQRSDKGLWFYRVGANPIFGAVDGFHHVSLQDAINELEGQPVDWPREGAK